MKAGTFRADTPTLKAWETPEAIPVHSASTTSSIASPETNPPIRKQALKAKYLECLRARSPLTLRQVVKDLLQIGVGRDLLLAWAMSVGHDRKYVGKLLSECLTALGVRQRQAGAGRRTSPGALVLLAFAHELFGKEHRKRLRAAWRAAGSAAGVEIEARGVNVIPEPELYSIAVKRFSTKLAESAKEYLPSSRAEKEFERKSREAGGAKSLCRSSRIGR